ncbi:hypothetical protein FHG87_020841 [Trinorchestia longiramus]|nr:hypothetical protein FHG87_020841 [Trinorchestia longiramus]
MDQRRTCIHKEENAQDLLRESSTQPRHCGLTLKTLDHLSPSMVTLESLVSEWPPNTYDSGYVPSPLSSEGRFTYPKEEGQGVSDEEYFGCTSETGLLQSVQRSSLCHPESRAYFSPNVARVTTQVEANAIRAGTPPIKIPTGKHSTTSPELGATADVSRDENAYMTIGGNDPYDDLDFSQIQVEDFTENKIEGEQKQDCFSSTRFVRPRTYSCPETYRSTPNRPPVPLFPPINSPVTPEVFDRQYPIYCDARGYLPKALTEPCTGKVQQYLSENPRAVRASSPFPLHSSQRGAVNFHEAQLGPDMGTGHFDGIKEGFPKGYVHTRFWSTPVTTASDGRPLLVPPTQVNIKPSGSRDAIVDLSQEGPGHRRRVLVLSLPDVVVETRPSFQTGVDVTEDSASLSHGREDSSFSSDALGPLQGPAPTSPVHLRPKRSTGRTYGRPRALSCDVTLEETVGRTLRHIADNFEPRRVKERRESNSLFGRVRRSVRRSFSRILNTSSETETHQPQPQNALDHESIQENLFYFPYDDLDDGDFGNSSVENESRQNGNGEIRIAGDCKMCGGEHTCVRHPNLSSAFCRLRLIETEIDGKLSYAFEQHEDYACEHYLEPWGTWQSQKTHTPEFSTGGPIALTAGICCGSQYTSPSYDLSLLLLASFKNKYLRRHSNSSHKIPPTSERSAVRRSCILDTMRTSS